MSTNNNETIYTSDTLDSKVSGLRSLSKTVEETLRQAREAQAGIRNSQERAKIQSRRMAETRSAPPVSSQPAKKAQPSRVTNTTKAKVFNLFKYAGQKVRCQNTQVVYDTPKQAAQSLGLRTDAIYHNLRGRVKSVGPDALVFSWVKDSSTTRSVAAQSSMVAAVSNVETSVAAPQNAVFSGTETNPDEVTVTTSNVPESDAGDLKNLDLSSESPLVNYYSGRVDTLTRKVDVLVFMNIVLASVAAAAAIFYMTVR